MKTASLIIKIAFLSWLVSLILSPLHAQEPGQNISPSEKKQATVTPNPEDSDGILQLRTKLEQQRQVLVLQSKQAEEAKDNNLIEKLSKELNLLSWLDYIYLQHLSALQHHKELEDAKIKLTEEQKTFSQHYQWSDEEKTFSFLEHLRDELLTEEEGMARALIAQQTANEALNDAKKDLEEKEVARRSLREEFDSWSEQISPQEKEERYHLASLETDIAKQNLLLRGKELENASASQQITTMRLEFLEKKISSLSLLVKMSEEDLDNKTGELNSQEKNFKKSLDATKAKLINCEKSYFELNKKITNLTEPDPALQEEQESYRLCRDIAEIEIGSLNERLNLIGNEKEIWVKRLRLQNQNITKDEQLTWQKELDQIASRIDQRNRIQNIRLAELRNQLSKLTSKLDLAKEGPLNVQRWLKEQSTHLQKGITVYEQLIGEVENLRHLIDKARFEVQEKGSSLSLTERIKNAINAFLAIWSYELFSVDDRPVSIKKIFIAIILIFLGIWASKKLSTKFAMKLLPRFGLRTGEAASLQSLIFYILVIFFTLFALQIVHLPLTIFTVLGGAIAIGVGFGSQNIMNNFISGIILLLERPIRAGDLVEVEGWQGRVQQIGARSTRILTNDNIDLVVPNSILLEKNVVNWTLSDERARTQVTVAVDYACEPEQVKALLLQAAEETATILKSPAPFAILADFGDNALVFKLFFWVSVSAMSNRLVLESDIRTSIVRIFRTHGITIPYPKRDMSLETISPLEIKILEKGK